MQKISTLIILDWDDTLFPTSWVVKNSINLNDSSVQNKYIVLFSKLDMLVHRLLSKLLKCGHVVIVTNAALKWINVSCSVLPNTRTLINKKIKIISARELYSSKFPNSTDMWKNLVFKNIVNDIKNPDQNIISIGDAEFEFNALIDLYTTKQKRYLKAVKLMSFPSFDSLIDQLEVLDKCVKEICTAQRHMDLKFENRSIQQL